MDTQPIHVLLIEDSPSAVDLVRGWLAEIPSTPFVLHTAACLAAGLQRLAAGGIDVILLDLTLPESEGLTTVQRVVEQAPTVPMVVLTALDDPALGLEVVQHGAEDYLVKGQVDCSTLVRSLQYAIERCRRRQAEESLRATREEFRAAQKHLTEQIGQQNRELSETTAFLNSILEGSTEYGIIATDPGGTMLTWNEGARRIYGYTAEEVVGRQTIRILHVAEASQACKVQALFDTALRLGHAEGVFECLRKDGRHILTSAVITLRRSATACPSGYVCISRDITAHKNLEKQLRRKNEELEVQYRRVREANRLKSEFLANMSHELRTPLNGILGFAELMHDGKVGPVSPTHREYLGDILSSARHLLQLINDILDLAKVESGKMEFRPELVDLARLVGEVRDILRALAARKRIRIGIEIDPRQGRVVVDPAKLKQVLYNYLSNALKFTPDEGRVTVRVGPEDATTFRLEVEDTGIGIAAEDLGRLFVEFQQLDGSAAKRYPGTGLGLALTKRIVESQGGRVGVRSTRGQGSVFFAVLPRLTRATAAAEDPARPPLGQGEPVPQGVLP